ncbi:TPA_asm: N [Brassica rapa virus 1]|uniref:Nucleoprotein n=1 Tax=Brassica rapa virus 1 TaxID=2793725 RepID=A0A8D9PH02_9RHAB|nr:N [Brassica rapa virus 1] [Brassica rapa virus 1]DAF42357.1 TPA_asm: N [Brassica rapa virus 1]
MDALNELRRATAMLENRKRVRDEVEDESEGVQNVSDAEEEVIAGPDMNVVEFADLETRKKAFLAKPIKRTEEQKYYESKTPMPCKRTWRDKEPGPKAIINLRRLTNVEIKELGAIVFEAISSEVSDKIVAGLFLLAFNAKDRDGSDIYADIPVDLIDEDKLVEQDKMSARIKKKVDGADVIKVKEEFADEQTLRDCYCFLAGTYMRMFTKSAENYVNIENKLVERFEHFYMANFPFEDFHPNLESAKAIKSILELSTIMKNTFYALLYAGESTEIGNNIKSYLYVTHISFTGLHPLVLFMKCMAAFKIGSGKLANAIHTSAYAKELIEICLFIEKFVDSEDEEMKFKMWRFARIFDDTFFSTLQTRHCKRLTLALSYLLKLVAPEENQNVLKIAQILHVSNFERVIAETFAQRAYQVIVEADYTGNYKGLEELVG